MGMTLGPTGLRNSAAFAHLADWSVYEDGRDIGRISEEHAPSHPDVAWSWSIYLMGPARGHVVTHGHGATLDEVKKALVDSLTKFRSWAP